MRLVGETDGLRLQANNPEDSESENRNGDERLEKEAPPLPLWAVSRHRGVSASAVVGESGRDVSHSCHPCVRPNNGSGWVCSNRAARSWSPCCSLDRWCKRCSSCLSYRHPWRSPRS